jgi:small-conductance mechanosensitive channel
VSASAFVSKLGEEAVQAIDAAQSLPLLYGWAVVMVTNPVARDMLTDVGWRLLIAVLAAVAVEYGLRRLMRRPTRSLEELAPPNILVDHEDDPVVAPRPDEAAAWAEPEDTQPVVAPKRPRLAAWVLLRRVPLVLARLVLELVPVLGIVVVGHLIAGSSLGGGTVSQLIILAVIDSYAICMTALSVARMLLSPGDSRMRLFHLPDSTAGYLIVWTRRLAVVAVFGYALGEVGLLLGLSNAAHDLLQKSIGLLLALMLAFIILRKRRAVRQMLRAPDGQTGFMAMLRNRFASVWHWNALVFLAAIWLVWAVEVPHGYTVVLRYFIVTTAVLIGARLTIVILVGVIERMMRPAPEVGRLSQAARARLHASYPPVAAAARFVIWVMSALGLLQLYGLNTFLWLTTSALGLRLMNAAATIALTVVVSFAVWEGANASIESHLDRLQREAQMARSARLRTLLPLLRTTLWIVIAIFAVLTILSEIGINVAPLLAGAGIIGVAIGFGSQKLVQDLINGIFLLLENAMQVGDFVTVSGLSGTVEALSVRAIRLRASDGSVHLIPFSNVTSVTNVNRGLGNASVNVTVDYNEDTDHVSAELKAIVAEMRNEPSFSAMMLSDLQLWGVDKVDGAGVTILGQVVCTDTGRWAVQREFNRRMKRRFQELGIRIFNPIRTVEVTQMMPMNAPPVDTPAVAAPSPTKLIVQGGERGQSQAAD